MILYDTKVAPNPRRVRIFLAEKGIDVPMVQVDLGKMEHKQADYSKINPLQRTPALVLDDGTTITESIAICRYFEELRPEPNLFGRGPVGCATVEMWRRRVELNLMLPTALVFRHTHPAMAQLEVPQIAQVAETSRPRVLDFLKVLDERLGETRWLGGDDFSIADTDGLVAMDFLRLARIQPPPELANVARWHGELSARPSAKA
ncbi:MAG TPA: glutathione S-transferase family protein [Rhodoblastus sp.]|nr:glutathione S-transferase family protein [Rhodoblastus sp.]